MIMPQVVGSWAGAVLVSVFGMLAVQNLHAQETVSGERLDPSTYGPSFVETMEAALERDRLAPPIPGCKERQGQPGVWAVPMPQATTKPHSGQHNVVNKWGDTHMGIGFPRPVDVKGGLVQRSGRLRSLGPQHRGDWLSGRQGSCAH